MITITINADKPSPSADFFVVQKLIEMEAQFSITAPHPTGDWHTSPQILITFYKGTYQIAFDAASFRCPVSIDDNGTITDEGTLDHVHVALLRNILEKHSGAPGIQNRTDIALSIIDFIRIMSLITCNHLITVHQPHRNGTIVNGEIVC